MARRNPGFVSKKPHRKSRGGCLICKKKKVKCDEVQPVCGYCSLRGLLCEYAQDHSPAKSLSALVLRDTSPGTSSDGERELDFNDSNIRFPGWILPASNTAIGQFTNIDFRLLDHYKTYTWRTFAIRGEGLMDALHRDTIPKLSIEYPFLLYALLAMAAAHSNFLDPNKQMENHALVYRQKTFQAYRNALQNINGANYEAILVTGIYLGALVPKPQEIGGDTEDCLEWMFSLLKLHEGLRILAGLRWSSGIEKLTVYPMLRRELRPLPPSPIVTLRDGSTPMQMGSGPIGATPDYPNPPNTYDTLRVLSSAENTVFLPPTLMDLLTTLIHPWETGQFDLDAGTLIPAIQAMSPIFSSLYFYHLNQDFYIRVFAFTTFLMPDFMQLVQNREPRAFALLAWRFALAKLVPQGWWTGGNLKKIVVAIGTVVQAKGDEVAIRTFEKALTLVTKYETEGRERAAASIFNDWEGINYEDGPKQAEEWETGHAVDLSDDFSIG